ncbi:hypothetical protein BT96DRAFT_285835 [Gymnopus androsaceus JB14]|uniref:Uncharacterized protein n=1 Tax=Gymnopus androsaceus JB14 TaxID=1447944 RepID=A0A6A4H4Z2_9AGAR|nr:hypothetical protein BT96DRAFT_285835 [Gymnopus androsaceus JB14]
MTIVAVNPSKSQHQPWMNSFPFFQHLQVHPLQSPCSAMLSSWADLLPLTLSVAFYIGQVYSLALTSFLPTETVTLYTVSVSQASKSAIATDVPPSISTGLSALGTLTLSDGSSTTYLEEEVEFSTTIVSGDITTLAPQSTTTAILIEGASGYDLLESSSDSWRDVRCSFQSGSSASCVESAGFVSSSDHIFHNYTG